MSEEIVLCERNVRVPALQEELIRLYSQGFLTDITLSTEDGKNFEAHRVLLAARSAYFHSVVPRLKTDPVIFLRGIKGAHLDKVLKFIYGSSVSVSKHQLKPILEVAKSLQVKGLQDVSPSDILNRQNIVGAGKFKPDSPLASPLLGKGPQRQPSMSSTSSFKSPQGKKGGRGGSTNRVNQNGGSQSDSDGDKSKGDSDADGVGTRTRKKRGRPPKKTNKEKESKGDPYEFEEEESNEGGDRLGQNGEDRKGWRYQNKKRKKDGEESEGNQEEDGEGKNKYSINNKEVLTVKCKGELGELHLSRFQGGMRGRSIKYKSNWMTPQEFVMVCGFSGKKYLENIQTDYGPLKALTASGVLRPQPSRNMKRSSRKDDEEEEEEENQNEEEEEDDEDEEEENEPSKDEEEEDEEETTVETAEASTDTSNLLKPKKKKKKHRDDWKRELTNQLKTESPNTIMVNHIGNHEIVEHSAQLQGLDKGLEANLMTIPHSSNTNTFIPVSFATVSLNDQPPKLSHSAILQDHGPQTLYVMSPHPSMATPPTPQHNPFASAMSPILSPMTPITSMATSMNNTMLTQKIVTSSAPSTVTSTGGTVSRIGSVINVRCKSTTALLYTNKYESGSKGKCIQLNDEWLTPNEFEDRSGSKAKKYLSSIKCMGRPLRVYVNSGELRGSGPPPAQKASKKKQLITSQNVMTPQHTITLPPQSMTPIHHQAIAPAPLQAPPTPSHISSAPQNLNLMMGHQPPILINQTSMANSMGLGANQGNLIQGMTFTLAQPLEVRHNGQTM